MHKSFTHLKSSLIGLCLLVPVLGFAQVVVAPPGGDVSDGGMSSGVIPKYDGTDLVDSLLSCDGTDCTLASGVFYLPNSGRFSFGGDTGQFFMDRGFVYGVGSNLLVSRTGGGGGTSPLTLTGASIYLVDGNASSALAILNNGTAIFGKLTANRTPTGTFEMTAEPGSYAALSLTTEELTIVDGDRLGQIDFLAPLESSGSDAILAGASIWAEADATFSATVNTTDLVFAVGTSEAAVEKMRVCSGGSYMFRDSDDPTDFSECTIVDGTWACAVDADGVCDGTL